MEHEIQENDIIVTGSDGVWDNLYKNEIMKCIQDSMVQNLLQNHQAVADCIMNKSFDYATDITKNIIEISPFETRANEDYNIK